MAVIEREPQSPTAADAQRTAWHTLSTEETLRKLETSLESGLSTAEAQRRLEKDGPNELTESARTSPLKILLEQLTDPMVMILLGAAAVSILLGKTVEVAAILAIVVLNAILGVTQEYRAEQAMAALKKMAAPSVRVRRDGREAEIPSHDVVAGDVVLLEAGNVVPADGRAIEVANLSVQESSLTGESVAVEKHTETLESPELGVGDRANMVFMGTAVTYGRGVVVITDTGMKTQLGRIATLIQDVESEKTPLQRRMAELGKVLFYAAIGIVVAAVAIGMINADWSNGFNLETLSDIFVGAVAIAVAVVPEGLPAVVTIALALGAQRMLRRRALIRKLPAVETLGSVTVICSDKTGTLTQNKMTVKIIDVADRQTQVEFTRDSNHVFSSKFEHRRPEDMTQGLVLLNAALSNDAALNETAAQAGDIQVIGDPTEAALMTVGALYDFNKNMLQPTLPRVAEVPFESDRKRMSTIHSVLRVPSAHLMNSHGGVDEVPLLAVDAEGQATHKLLVLTKGAVDSLLDVCGYLRIGDKIEPMTPEYVQRINDANDRHAEQGLRVLGFAYRQMDALPEQINADTIERDLIFSGMIGMIDPPRPEVKLAVEESLGAGIRPIMITGDHPLTAFAIAKELKIVQDDATHHGRVVTGKDLNRMTPDELDKAVASVSVFARVSPEHKLNIVQALQRRGNIVSMTGDGVNDAPALKKADIGVAMGITGTAVSKEASDMVILDDNFATIVNAVEEGRTIYDNVRKFVKYILGSNVGEVGTLFATQLLGLALPLTTLQILWMNLVTDGLPALALSVEKGEADRMTRPPYSPKESLFSRGLGSYLLRVGFVIFLVGMSVVLFFPVERTSGEFVSVWTELTSGIKPLADATEGGKALWSTMIFTTLVFSQMGHALAVRSERKSLLQIGLFSNMAAVIAIGLTISLQLVMIYTPFLNDLFNTAPLALDQLLLAFAIGLVTLFYVEFDKLMFGRRAQNKANAAARADAAAA